MAPGISAATPPSAARPASARPGRWGSGKSTTTLRRAGAGLHTRARPRRSVPSASGSPARTAGPISAARPRARRSRTRKRRPYWRGSARTRCGTFPATGTPSAPRVAAKRTPLAALLMDQKVIAGVGNVYRAELLFRQRLNPWLPGAELSPDAARRLWDDTAAMMSDGVRDGRIITTPPQYWNGAGAGVSRGVLPAPEEAHFVYRRHGLGLPGLRNAGGADRARRPEALLVPGLPAGLSRYACPSTPALPSSGAPAAGARRERKKPLRRGAFFVIFLRGRRESNPRNQFGRLRLYH